MTQGSDQDRKDVQTSFFVVFLETGKRFFWPFSPTLWKLGVVQTQVRFTSPQSDPPGFLKAFSMCSTAIKKKKVLLRKKTKPLGQVESIWKTPSCYIEWFILKKIPGTCSTRAYSSGNRAKKVLWFVPCLDEKTPPTFPPEAFSLLSPPAPRSVLSPTGNTQGRQGK